MTNRDTIMQIIDWIEGHLQEEFTVAELSRRAGYSLYYFIRLFQGVTGYAPKDYIMRRKLTEAAKELLSNRRRKVSDVAFDYRFHDHETFTRAFKRFFGITPAECKSGVGIQSSFFEMPTVAQLSRSSRCYSGEPDVEPINGFMIVGPPAFAGFGESLAEQWRAFQREVHGIRQRLIPERFCQFAFWNDSDENGGFNVIPSVVVANLDDIPLTMVGKTIPDGLYLRFVHRGPIETIAKTYGWIYESYLPQSEYKLTLPFNFECYDRYQSTNEKGSYIDIYIPLEIAGC
jgi:AraC family transcriptional regulator